MSCHSISWTDCTDSALKKLLTRSKKKTAGNSFKKRVPKARPIRHKPYLNSTMAYITMKVSRVTTAAMRQTSIRCFPMLAWRDHELFELFLVGELVTADKPPVPVAVVIPASVSLELEELELEPVPVVIEEVTVPDATVVEVLLPLVTAGMPTLDVVVIGSLLDVVVKIGLDETVEEPP